MTLLICHFFNSFVCKRLACSEVPSELPVHGQRGAMRRSGKLDVTSVQWLWALELFNAFHYNEH